MMWQLRSRNRGQTTLEFRSKAAEIAEQVCLFKDTHFVGDFLYLILGVTPPSLIKVLLFPALWDNCRF